MWVSKSGKIYFFTIYNRMKRTINDDLSNAYWRLTISSIQVDRHAKEREDKELLNKRKKRHIPTVVG